MTLVEAGRHQAYLPVRCAQRNSSWKQPLRQVFDPAGDRVALTIVDLAKAGEWNHEASPGRRCIRTWLRRVRRRTRRGRIGHRARRGFRPWELCGRSGRRPSSLSKVLISRAACFDELRIDLGWRPGGPAALHATLHDRPDAIGNDSRAVPRAATFEAGVATRGEDLLTGARRPSRLGHRAHARGDRGESNQRERNCCICSAHLTLPFGDI
jgi:hypothetical protein